MLQCYSFKSEFYAQAFQPYEILIALWRRGSLLEFRNNEVLTKQSLWEHWVDYDSVSGTAISHLGAEQICKDNPIVQLKHTIRAIVHCLRSVAAKNSQVIRHNEQGRLEIARSDRRARKREH